MLQSPSEEMQRPLTCPQTESKTGAAPAPGGDHRLQRGPHPMVDGPGQGPSARTWAYLNHHTAPDVIPPGGDPPVSEALLQVFDGLPVPAAACFSVSEGFGCGDLSAQCFRSEQVPTRGEGRTVPHPRAECLHVQMCAHIRVPGWCGT